MSVLRIILALALLVAVHRASAVEAAQPDPATQTGSYEKMVALVDLFNPNLDPVAAKDSDPSDIITNNSFIGSASEHAEGSTGLTVFAFWIFMPFLVLPQILLLVAIIRFRDRKDGRKPATFVHNNLLEVVWTAIPILTLIVVAIPATIELYRIDNPPANDVVEDRLNVTVTAKRFAWIFDYSDYGIELANDPRLGPGALSQESMVFEKDRITYLTFNSLDVNHAWSVPAFGVRKDCFPIPRPPNYAWFTPLREGIFEGQCYELCGEGHGRMMFNAIVVDKPLFDRWVGFYRNKLDAGEVVSALRESGDTDAVKQAIAAYLGGGVRGTRIDALRYWTVLEYHALAQQAAARGANAERDDYSRKGRNILATLDAVITSLDEGSDT